MQYSQMVPLVYITCSGSGLIEGMTFQIRWEASSTRSRRYDVSPRRRRRTRSTRTPTEWRCTASAWTGRAQEIWYVAYILSLTRRSVTGQALKLIKLGYVGLVIGLSYICYSRATQKCSKVIRNDYLTLLASMTQSVAYKKLFFPSCS